MTTLHFKCLFKDGNDFIFQAPGDTIGCCVKCHNREEDDESACTLCTAKDLEGNMYYVKSRQGQPLVGKCPTVVATSAADDVTATYCKYYRHDQA